MREVICQEWEESEREPGWGVTVRSDGFSLHRTTEHAKAYLENHWKDYPKETPDYYIRPAGSPYIVTLRSNSKLYKDLLKSRKKGIRLGEKTPRPKRKLSA